MNATMKKNFVIAGNTIAEVEADLRALKAMVASGMTSGCGGQTAQAALEAQSAMRQVYGWAPDGVMMEAADPKPASPSPSMENVLSLMMAVAFGSNVPEESDDDEEWDDEPANGEEVWEEEVTEAVHEAIDGMVEVIQNTASGYNDHKLMARILVNCATDLLVTALRDATAEESRGEALQDLINTMDELAESLDTCK